MTTAQIRVGIGGWTFEPWRDNFFPKGLPHSQELSYASRQLSAIEVNGTYYSLQSPKTFARWRDETPDGFVLSLKAPRYTTNRRVLADAGESIEKFVGSGLAELGDKLGPLVWQLPPTKEFDPDDLAAFLRLLPRRLDGRPLRHVLDVRHPSFMTTPYLALAREHGVVTVFADSADYPSFADLTGEFVYARLMRSQSHFKAGYAPKALQGWAEAAQTWARGDEPAGLPRVESARAEVTGPRDVYVFFISGAKERAPAAAVALLKALG